LKARYNLTGTESYNLVEAGLDSLDLVVFMHEIKELLKNKDADMLARQVDIGLIQRVSVAELFRLANSWSVLPKKHWFRCGSTWRLSVKSSVRRNSG
jgi:aryl carrier-like protein